MNNKLIHAAVQRGSLIDVPKQHAVDVAHGLSEIEHHPGAVFCEPRHLKTLPIVYPSAGVCPGGWICWVLP